MKRYRFRGNTIDNYLVNITEECLRYITDGKDHADSLIMYRIMDGRNNDAQYLLYGDALNFQGNYDFTLNQRAGVLR